MSYLGRHRQYRHSNIDTDTFTQVQGEKFTQRKEREQQELKTRSSTTHIHSRFGRLSWRRTGVDTHSGGELGLDAHEEEFQVLISFWAVSNQIWEQFVLLGIISLQFLLAL